MLDRSKLSLDDRRSFLGGSEARIVFGNDEKALIRLWREKRGEIEPPDLSDNLIVQLGSVTEDLNRRWYEAQTGYTITHVQHRFRRPTALWLAATVDGRVKETGAIFEAKFMLPWQFSEQAALAKYAPQLQHNMWVAEDHAAVLSVITGGGKWVEITTRADPLYQYLLITAERRFWECVVTGEQPRLYGVTPPPPKIEAVRFIDMSTSNTWAQFAGAYTRTHDAYLEHEDAKANLKSLMPYDAREAIGHGVRVRRSKSGAVSIELFDNEDAHVSVQ
jgi:predicted phage-related endonuclease